MNNQTTSPELMGSEANQMPDRSSYGTFKEKNATFRRNAHPELHSKLSMNYDLMAAGASESGKMSGHPVGLEMWLHKIYFQAVANVRGLSEQQNEKIKELETAIAGLEGHNKTIDEKTTEIEAKSIPQVEKDLDAALLDKNTKIEARKKDIDVLENEIVKIKGGDTVLIGAEVNKGDRWAFYIGTFVLAFLSLYLVLFYTSVIYNAFIADVTSAMAVAMRDRVFTPTIINLDAIPNTFDLFGVLGLLFLLAAPFVFLGLGYLTHKLYKDKRYGLCFSFLAFTLIFDILLAFEIVKKIYKAEVSANINATQQWDISMAFSDPAFYIIICAGFLVYVLWGFLFGYVLEEAARLEPALAAVNVRKKQVEHLKDEIKAIKTKYEALVEKLNAKLAELRSIVEGSLQKKRANETAIDVKTQEIQSIRSQIEVPVSDIIDKLKTFGIGWINHVNSAHTEQNRNAIIDECNLRMSNFIDHITHTKTTTHVQ